MNIFSYDELTQQRNILKLYKSLTTLFLQGIVVAKYREAIIINSLVQNQYEIEEEDTLAIMSAISSDDVIVLNYELDGPINLDKLSILEVLTEPILLDSSYLLFKQQVEIGIERLVHNSQIQKDYKISVTVNIEDYLDGDEILWDIKLNVMQGQTNGKETK